jgi:ubiquitin thioesterase protein OTUB1
MFRPQATPYSPFSSYGVGAPIADFPGFQPAGGGQLVVDSGGPTLLRDPVFSPVASSTNNPGQPLNFTTTHSNNNTLQRFKMSGGDMETQEALAREYQPQLEVRNVELGV